jgi:hypothetical protein
MIHGSETGGVTKTKDSQALSSWLADYDRQQSTIGLINYAERLAQYISQLDYERSNKIMDGYFDEEDERRRLWNPDEECNIILVGYSPNCQNSYLELDDGDPYTEALSVWVNGVHIIPSAQDSRGDPLIIYHCGPWFGDSLLQMQIETIGGHPYDTYNLYDALKEIMNPDRRKLQRIYSLLIWDCELKQMSIEHPTHDQIWTDPQVRIEEGQWAIYPTTEACDEGVPDRVVAPMNPPMA